MHLWFHLLTFSHHFFVLLYCHENMDTKDVKDREVLIMLKYRFFYFTSWNFFIQIIYFGLAIWYDVLLRLQSKQKQLATILKWKSYLYTSIIFPSGFFVPGMFWGLYNIEKEYVYPKSCELYFPTWLNHSLHTVTCLVVFIESFVVDHPQQNLLSAIKGYSALFFLYHIWYVASRFFLGTWLYPVFNLMTGIQVFFFIIFYYLWNICLVVLGIEIEKIKHNNIQKKQKML